MKQLKPLKFNWDKGNINKNKIKHNVEYYEAEEIFFNEPLKIYPDNKHSKEEKRYLALGITEAERQLSVIFTVRNQKIRVISARDQSKKERQTYEKK